MTDLPWYLWAIFGFGGSVYTIIWTLFSKPKEVWNKDPVILKISWTILSILLFYIGLDNLEKGGYVIFYKKEMDDIVKLVFAIWWGLFWMGGYQKVMRKGYPLDKRITTLKCLVITNVAMGILLLIVNFKWLKGFFG